ncbi:CAP160 protein [Actinidia rufa]|uniref:CAP160 protein n=1 Tax=Actinidia rufa TaxID=165716 RepID=A0A7J0ECZ9_9ERIC|nr:CAP160 protein [Actinidia rufa]
MEAQMPPPRGHNYDEQPLIAGLPEGEDHEQHHGKKSVLKKVKAKAKKIKETLTKHGHGHDHDDEEDEEEEMEEDPEVHGAPMYESTAIRGGVPGPQPGVNLEKPTVMAEDRHDSKYTDPPTRQAGEKTRQTKVSVGKSTALEEDPHAPKELPEVSNYQSKVTDPTGDGGEEAGITPILSAFNKMNVSGELKSNPKAGERPKSYAGSHDQFASEQRPAHTTTDPEMPGLALKSFHGGSNPDDMPCDTFTKQPSGQGGYTEKISSATSAITDKAIAAKNAVISKLGYGTREGEETGKSGSNITATVTEKLSPMSEKVANVGTSVMSKVHGSETGQERGDIDKRQGKAVSMKEYLAEKLSPSDEDKALSEVISDALHKRKQEVGENAEAEKPVGKVTESEEVKKRLGTTGDKDFNREGGQMDSQAAANLSATGKAVVDRVKGAVGSWFVVGRDQSSQSSQVSPGTTYGQGGLSSSTSEESGLGQDRVGE